VALRVRPLEEGERPWLEEQLGHLWGSPTIVSRGRVYDGARLPALVCMADGDVVGLATYDVRDGQCELLTLNAFTDGRGIGSALLEAVAEEARRRACSRLWLITTNDNLRALRFYQRRGFRLSALHRDALERSRELKPSIPEIGLDGIPLRDELELELELRL
jgi:ribosomal protein S18 acetylase RimI-like enzyme